MEDYRAIIRNAFEMGSVFDATTLFEDCIQNAFPTFHFRGLQLIRFLASTEYLEGKSLNHVFEIHPVEVDGGKLWQVDCRRVTMGKTPDKMVLLDYLTLGFVSYIEK